MWAKKKQRKKTPPEFARAGAEEDSSADNMVLSRPETTTNTDSTVQENTVVTSAPTGAADHKLQTCTCGWRKITSHLGLRIHQGKKRCLREERIGSGAVEKKLWETVNADLTSTLDSFSTLWHSGEEVGDNGGHHF